MLRPVIRKCPVCHRPMWAAYNNRRTLMTLQGTLPLRLKIYRCMNENCQRYHQLYRPELEGRYAVPNCQFGLDVILAVGEMARKSPVTYRSRERDSLNIAGVQATLKKHGIAMSVREIRNLRKRYELLLQNSPTNDQKTLETIQQTGYSILDIFEVPSAGNWTPLWIIRDWCSGAILATIVVNRGGQIRLLSMLEKVSRQLKVRVTGIISDGHPSIRKAINKQIPASSTLALQCFEISSTNDIRITFLSASLQKIIPGGGRYISDLCSPGIWEGKRRSRKN